MLGNGLSLSFDRIEVAVLDDAKRCSCGQIHGPIELTLWSDGIDHPVCLTEISVDTAIEFATTLNTAIDKAVGVK